MKTLFETMQGYEDEEVGRTLRDALEHGAVINVETLQDQEDTSEWYCHIYGLYPDGSDLDARGTTLHAALDAAGLIGNKE